MHHRDVSISSLSHREGGAFPIEYSAATTAGACRVVNEDTYGIFEDGRVFVVADGCGGASSGESAARLTVQSFGWTLNNHVMGLGDLSVADPLAISVLRANAEVYREAHTNPARRGEGAAVCAVRFFERHLTVVHVGDCRVGRYRDEGCVWLTQDHSLVAEMRRKGAPADTIEEVARFHQNVMVRAVGVREHLAVDVSYHPSRPGDLYLLCSDGLWNQVQLPHITRLLGEHSRSLRGGCAALLEASEAAGGHDNATVILVRLGS